MIEGTVVISGTGQAGTLISLTQDQAQVLLRNGEIWVGNPKQVRIPQSDELEHAPIDIEHREPARKKVSGGYE